MRSTTSSSGALVTFNRQGIDPEGGEYRHDQRSAGAGSTGELAAIVAGFAVQAAARAGQMD